MTACVQHGRVVHLLLQRLQGDNKHMMCAYALWRQRGGETVMPSPLHSKAPTRAQPTVAGCVYALSRTGGGGGSQAGAVA